MADPGRGGEGGWGFSSIGDFVFTAPAANFFCFFFVFLKDLIIYD